MKRNQWRTLIVACSGMACLLAGLGVVAGWPAVSAAYPAFCGGIGFCVGAVAAKAVKEHQVVSKPEGQEAPK